MKKLLKSFGTILVGIKKTPLADVLFLVGLLTLGYGLYLFRVWIAYSIIGLILLGVAIGLGRGERK